MPHRLTYDEGTHTYYWEGRRVSSVTQVLNEWIECDNWYVNTYTGEKVPAWAFKEGGEFGTAFHKAAFLITTGHNIKYHESLDYAISELRRWLVKEEIKPVGSEVRVYSQKLNIAGTLDFAFYMKGHKDLCIVDFKSSKDAPLVGPQTAGYEEGYRYLYGYKKKIRRYVFHPPKKEGYRYLYGYKKKIRRYVFHPPKKEGEYRFVELTDRSDRNMLKSMNFAWNFVRQIK